MNSQLIFGLCKEVDVRWDTNEKLLHPRALVNIHNFIKTNILEPTQEALAPPPPIRATLSSLATFDYSRLDCLKKMVNHMATFVDQMFTKQRAFQQSMWKWLINVDCVLLEIG